MRLPSDFTAMRKCTATRAPRPAGAQVCSHVFSRTSCKTKEQQQQLSATLPARGTALLCVSSGQALGLQSFRELAARGLHMSTFLLFRNFVIPPKFGEWPLNATSNHRNLVSRKKSSMNTRTFVVSTTSNTTSDDATFDS